MGISNFAGNGSDGGNGGSTGVPPSGGSLAGALMGAPPAGFDAESVLINYNKKFAQAGRAPFREKIADQLAAALITKNKPNPLLVGPAGCGKTRVVEDLAFRIASKDPSLPSKLAGATVYELPLSALVAGSGIRGELEEKARGVIEFISDPRNDAILFVDEIHQLAENAWSSYATVAQILKPALARGGMRCIGATTTQEAGALADDPALNRRFTRIVVDEFSPGQTKEILALASPGFVKHYNNKILIPPDVLPCVVRLADEYRPAGSHRPDNALTLLDQSCADAIVDYNAKLAAAQSDPALLAALQSVRILSLTESRVRQTAMRVMTGGASRQELDAGALRAALSRIKGQDGPIAEIVRHVKRRDRGLFPSRRPLALLLAGSSGVGKTETAKIVAEQVTGTKPIVLDMTEYHSPASINRIIGAPAGYVGSDSKAELPFDALESNPYQVILLDEFEKCDEAVQTLFMGAFDEGYIRTSKGKYVDFSRCIIFATTNAGRTNVSRPIGYAGEPSGAPAKAGVAAGLSKYMRQELLNRFTAILSYNPIDKETYREILVSAYAAERDRIRAERPRIALPDAIPDGELDRIVEETYVEAFGARPAMRAVERFVEDAVP